jgi:hypothetical protein
MLGHQPLEVQLGSVGHCLGCLFICSGVGQAVAQLLQERLAALSLTCNSARGALQHQKQDSLSGRLFVKALGTVHWKG